MDRKNTPRWAWVRGIMPSAIGKKGRTVAIISTQCQKLNKTTILMVQISKASMVLWILMKWECKSNVNSKERSMLEDVQKNWKRSSHVFITAEKNMPLMLLGICTCVRSIMKLQRQKEIEKHVTSSKNVDWKITQK